MIAKDVSPCDSAKDEQETPPSEVKPKTDGASSRIKYRVEYMNPDEKVVYQYDTTGRDCDEDISTKTDSVVLELVTTLFTNQETHDGTLGSRPTARSVPPKQTLHIHSRAIMQALRSVVQYYPRQDLSSDIVKISWPYAVLVHHYEELMQYKDRCQVDADSNRKLCLREESAFEHIGILKDFLDENIMPAVEEERERNQRGYRTFDMFWVNQKPGHAQIIQGDNDGDVIGIIHSVSGGSLVHPKAEWVTRFWVLKYDGEKISRCLSSATCQVWDGEAPIDDDVGDIRALPRKGVVADFIRKGQLYWSLLRKQCRYCKGRTATFPHNELDGLVMVDIDAYYEQFPTRVPDLMDSKSDSRSWVSDCTCSVCSGRREAEIEKGTAPFQGYTVYPRVTGVLDTDLLDEQYLLLPGFVQAYVFRTRSWEVVSVDSLSEPTFENGMIENLVMNSKHVDLLKALAKTFIRLNQFGEKSDQEQWSADFVKGKGSGLIFLLHGKPGVGKTLTAECIASFTNRPLMVLTSSDIGVSPEDIESNLTRHFKQAKRWGAVLLIDEADVFMERRSVADLTRNSLVAGFLRALEFYDGILFLTTNRVGSFDDAFLSRIHVQLYYPDFDESDRRKVWQTFIDKLLRERGHFIRLNIDAKEYLEGKELRAVKWNGREIRNAFQTAVALAEYEAVKDSEGKIVLTDKHLKSVVEMSRDFKNYIDDIHQGNEDIRAERRRER